MTKLCLFFAFCLCGFTNAYALEGYKKGIPARYWYYKLHTTPRTWAEASLVCQSENARLAVINSEEEARLYVAELNKFPHASIPGDFDKDSISLGYYRRLDDPSTFVTVDGGYLLEESGFLKWAPNQSNISGNDENCGSMLRNGLLNVVSCKFKPLMFFCETLFFSDDIPETEPQCETFEGGYRLGAYVGDRFYKLHVEPKSWDEASLVCQKENAQLAVINSEAEADQYAYELQRNPEDAIPGNFNKGIAMLGFHERLNPGEWTTLNGLPLNETGYNTWSPGRPDYTLYQEHCGGMFPDGLLNNLPCNEPFMFICEKPQISKLWARTPKGKAICTAAQLLFTDQEDYDVTKGLICETYAEGYKKSNGKYFKLHTQPRNWDYALMTCQSEGATLAVVSSDEEAKVYSEEIAKRSPNKDLALVGFHDRLDERNFTLLNGTLLSDSGYSKWSPLQPSEKRGKKHCGSINKNGLLISIDCDSPYVFICEKNSLMTDIVH